MENTTLGKCCICERENETVRNVIMLHKKSPNEKGGWGCFVCGLEARGAVAVLCDFCLKRMTGNLAKIRFACLGYPGENQRIEIEKLTENFEHNLSKHPEIEPDSNSESADVLDWDEALRHFREVRKRYQDLIVTPGVNTTLALENVFHPLAVRFYRGERSPELFKAMMAVE